MSNRLDTDDWHLGYTVNWIPKKHKVNCNYCGGNGTHFGFGPTDIDDNRECTHCNGSGVTYENPKTPPPPIPEELIERLRRIWWDYAHEKEGNQ